MRQIRTSGSMSGKWKRSVSRHRATSRLYPLTMMELAFTSKRLAELDEPIIFNAQPCGPPSNEIASEGSGGPLVKSTVSESEDPCMEKANCLSCDCDIE